MAVDWGDGDYEPTADALRPAATRLVEAAGVAAGQHVADIGCGTGNVALIAAAAGARATGVDRPRGWWPAPRNAPAPPGPTRASWWATPVRCRCGTAPTTTLSAASA